MTTDPLPPLTVNERVARNVKAEMARRDAKQADLAQVLDLSRQQLGERLAGRIEWTLPVLVTTAQALGVPLSTLAPDSLTEV